MNGSVNPLTTKLFRVRKTVFKMITKRGYSVDDNDMNMTLDTFLREVTKMDPRKKQLCDAEGNPNLNNMTIPVSWLESGGTMQARRIDSDDDNDRIVVFFIRGNDKKVVAFISEYEQINGKEFEAKVAQMATDHVKRVILVFGGELTSDAKKVWSCIDSSLETLLFFYPGYDCGGVPGRRACCRYHRT